MIYVDGEKCTGCGICEDVCPVEAVRVSDGVARIDQDKCNECEACIEVCPNEAVLVVIEPAEVTSDQSSVVPYQRPASEVALAELHRTPTPLRTKVVPVVGAALAFLGREVAPRLATYLVDALDRRLSQQPNAVSPTNNLAPLGSRKGGQKGRRHQHRRRGK
jgi:NAD-dependent dihydropyrimidine dehydrogenase PreA subunit